MTYNKLGRAFRLLKPSLRDIPADDETLALTVLSLDLESYDLVAPTAKRLKEISDRPRMNRPGIFEERVS